MLPRAIVRQPYAITLSAAVLSKIRTITILHAELYFTLSEQTKCIGSELLYYKQYYTMQSFLMALYIILCGYVCLLYVL